MTKILVLMYCDYDTESFLGCYVIPNNMNVELEEKLYSKSKKKESFEEWLLKHGARETTKDEAFTYYID